MIQYTGANNQSDLECILALQQANLPTAISAETLKKEGFVTVQHDFQLLKKMNQPFPHIVAKAAEKVVGYTLVMMKNLRNDIPVLVPMFDQIDQCSYKGKPLKNSKYFMMGQVCIDKAYRGKGLFKGLYEALRVQMHNDFDYLITEIAQRNPRSLKAHAKVGFETLTTYTADDGEVWVIVILSLLQDNKE